MGFLNFFHKTEHEHIEKEKKVFHDNEQKQKEHTPHTKHHFFPKPMGYRGGYCYPIIPFSPIPLITKHPIGRRDQEEQIYRELQEKRAARDAKHEAREARHAMKKMNRP